MGIWIQAREMASNTPENRNRYVDFLRALSILFVISGHWLIATAFFNQDTGVLTPVTVLDVMPSTLWLTWIFQVMPIFFIVGGYSNAVSLESARKKQIRYADWLVSRLHRLLSPMLLLIAFWVVVSFAMNLFGTDQKTIIFASQAALVPTWFLAIYAMIVILAPLTYAFWRKFGLASLLVYILMAVLVDLAFFNLDWQWLGWSNYFWVWLAAHHLGFVWRDGKLENSALQICLAIGAFATFASLIFYGPYPLAMAGSPEGDAVSNTLPPKITLIALGLFQFGLLRFMENPVKRLLENNSFWAAIIIINTMIMTVYLWHMTVLITVFVISYFADGFGLSMEVGSQAWWWTRPIWLLTLTVLLLPIALALSPLERIGRPEGATTPASWRLILGAALVGFGLVFATLFGLAGNLLDWKTVTAISLILVGAATCGLTPQLKKST